LREQASEAIELIQDGLPFHPGVEIRENLYLAYCGLVKEAVVKTKASRPNLNVEDILEHY
jgi:hypothetical protein